MSTLLDPVKKTMELVTECSKFLAVPQKLVKSVVGLIDEGIKFQHF